MRNLKIYEPTLDDWFRSTMTMGGTSLDFGDSIVLASMQSNNIEELISFDKHFDTIKDIQRVEPIDVLKVS